MATAPPAARFQMILLLLLLPRIAAIARHNTLHPNCQEFCGNFSIPYPFGIGQGCYRNDNFSYEITCKETGNGTMLPFSGNINSSLPVFDFSVPNNQATMFKYLTYECYNASGITDYQNSGLTLRRSPFTISTTRNRFTAVGCNTRAYINGTDGSYVSGCMSFCKGLDYSTTDSCNGIGCCQTSLPENLVQRC